MIELFLKYKKVILAGLTTLGLIFALGYVIIEIKSCAFQSGIDRQRANVNTQLQEANKITETIANLQLKKVEVEANSNQAILDLHRIQNDVNSAQENSNRSAENVNKIETANYNNISVNEANSARCKAFKDDPGC